MKRLKYLKLEIERLRSLPELLCVEWPFSTDPHGYGQVWYNKKVSRVHRVAYNLHHGRKPDALVLHRCDNPRCFNPFHLFAGTHADNSSDASEKGRLTGARPSKRNGQNIDKMVRLLSGGALVRDVAKSLGVSQHTVYRCLRLEDGRPALRHGRPPKNQPMNT